MALVSSAEVLRLLPFRVAPLRSSRLCHRPRPLALRLDALLLTGCQICQIAPFLLVHYCLRPTIAIGLSYLYYYYYTHLVDIVSTPLPI